jgi:hypothetical protein
MIVWLTPESVEMPVQQRAEVIEATPDRVIVVMCGNDQPKAVKPGDICGVELSEQVSVFFKQCGKKTQLPGSPYPHGKR